MTFIDRTRTASDQSALADRYEQLYLGVVSDAVAAEAGPTHFLGRGIRPLTASTPPLAGPAFTVVGEPSTPESYRADAHALLGMFDQLPAGVVLVYQTNDTDSDAAHFGELSATTVQARGARGIVLDGSVRDSRRLQDMGFATYCAGRSPLDGYGRWRIVDYQVPIRVHGVDIHPGDMIMADQDGAMSIPENMIEAVLNRAESDSRTEDQIRSSINAEQSSSALFDQYGRF